MTTPSILSRASVVSGFTLLTLALTAGLRAELPPERLTSKQRIPTPKVKPVAVGDEVRTEAGQRRRLVLPDGSVVYVNQESSIKVNAPRRLTLTRGEVFVETVPGEAFMVATPKREMTASGTRFAVRAEAKGAAVLVTNGEVKVSGLRVPVHAGQQLAADSDKPLSSPRVTHLLDWTKDLMAAAESPLVPASQHAGGALVAVDPDGQEAKLSLRKFHIDVHIEDGFARTTIDQTYFNHHDARLEGTFFFPLPADASLSRLAMYVDGNLMEGGMVERDFGRAVYEEILYRQKDPALLEWVDGSTFKMRVFPLEARQEKRIVLSYSQRLPSLYGQLQYRFPTGHSLDAVRDWSFHARIKNGAATTWNSASHPLKAIKDGNDLLLDAAEKNVRLDRDVQLGLADESTGEARFTSMDQDGASYLMLRYRPALPIENRKSKIENRQWVFLFESSGDRDPLLARTQIDIIHGLLAHAEPDDTLVVLAAGTRVKALSDKPQPVTPQNVQAAIAFLESSHLIGALDLGRALTEAETFLKGRQPPLLVHIGSGIAAMGERRDDVLVKKLASCRYVGVGVGKRWARSFMKTAAERTGGLFTQINPDEPISWRTFDLAATLQKPCLLDLRVTDKAGKATFLPFTTLLPQGEELCAVGRIDGTLPASIVVHGTLNGQPFEHELPVRDVTPSAGYLPRTWAKLEIERLLAEDAKKHKDRIVALSKAMYVMTPFTSLLVLENEEMYQQYKVDRGRKDHWAMYPCPAKMPVVAEDADGQPIDPRKGAKPTERQVQDTVLRRELYELLREPPRRTTVAPQVDWFGGDEGSREKKPDQSGARRPSSYLSLLRPASGHLNYYSLARAQASMLPVNDSFAGTESGPVLRRHRGRPVLQQADLPQLPGGLDEPEATAAERISTQARFLTAAATRKIKHQMAIRGFTETRNKVVLRDVLPRSSVHERIVEYDNDGLWLPRDGGGGTPDIQGQIEEPFDPSTWETPWLLYHRPTYSGEVRFFFDLVAYAPGMSVSRADVLGVIEAEAGPSAADKAGRIDAAARKLIENARRAGWQALALSDVTINFDTDGRYVYERTLPPGIRERVVCDGKTLLHLYPDLGIGARRAVSRFHRLDFARSVPWFVSAGEELARGADLKAVDQRTVAVVPRGVEALKDDKGKPISYARLHLVFAADGRLAERQIVEMPANKVLVREVLGADGTIAVLDEKGKEVSKQAGKLTTAKQPDLTADISKLVVLPLPYRDADHVKKTLKIENKAYQELRFEDDLALFAAHFGKGTLNEAQNVFRHGFYERNQRQLGFYVLLAALGANLDSQNLDVLAEHLNEPLAQYLALHSSPVLRKHASQWAVVSGQWQEGFLRHLVVTHALYQRWQNPKALGDTPAQRQAERDRALDYVHRNKGSVFGWALLGLMLDRTDEEEQAKKDVRAVHRALAEAWPLFAEVPGLGYAARYEHARSLWKSGQREQGRKRFRELYEQTLKDGGLPPIDADFRSALLGNGTETDQWSDLLRRTAAGLIEKKQRAAVLTLAWQCQQLDDEPLADYLLAAALDGAADKERPSLTLAAVEFHAKNGQLDRADRRLQSLLDDPKWAKSGSLWRLAMQIAERRQNKARALECLERALDAEYRRLPEVINIKAVREDYDKLLSHYQNQIDALVSLKVGPPADFLAKVVRTADRWRALDSDGESACQAAGRILQALGQRELVWDYLTTPVGLRPNESESWAGLARTLGHRGELDLADRAYAAAFAAEPTNAQILWDRAANLRQSGKLTEARKLYRQLAEGSWQPRFTWLQTQARWQLERP
jgi:ferric-dicitrate binding protein FerR (iron transport regulator)